MRKLRVWLYTKIEPFLVLFLSFVFPTAHPEALTSVVKRAGDYEPEGGRPKPFKGDLSRIYRRHRNPQSSYRIFYLRVKYLGWDIGHALKTPDRKNEIRLAGQLYTLREVYNNTLDKVVDYNTFYNRVVKEGWKPEKALKTPA